jgi:hypothetical protein
MPRSAFVLALLVAATAGGAAAFSQLEPDGRLLAARYAKPERASARLASGPLQTAILDDVFLRQEAPTAYAHTRLTGATAVRMNLYWKEVALRQPREETNPADPAYDWTSIDRAVRLAVRNGLMPILSLYLAPDWATQRGPAGTSPPDPARFGRFARAAASRYSGAYRGLPRVRYWQSWNEPNISIFLSPQFDGRRPFSPGHYRRLTNELARAVKAVRADNVVIAGGTAPFRDITDSVKKVNPAWGPLSFMRELLCLSRSLTRKCRAPIQLDVWSHHPYTSGGPTHHANLPDDVSLADLPEMRKVLLAGIRAGNVVSSGPVRFWVTEFSWDSKPPDPRGVPTALLSRWVSEALYRMWRSGVSLVTWFSIRDEPLTSSFYQSSLFYRGASFADDRPKRALQAFRFPLVAFRNGARIDVWGRTPASRPGTVAIEQQTDGRWRQLGVLRSDRFGVFQHEFTSRAPGPVRARLLATHERSLAFSLRRVPDRFFNPFGQETILEQPVPSRRRR